MNTKAIANRQTKSTRVKTKPELNDPHRKWERITFYSQIAGTIAALIFGYLAYSTSKETVEISKEATRYAKATAELDAEYKKLSIQPIISPAQGANDLSLKFKNIGLGPAKINRILIQYGAICLDSETDPNFAQNFEDALQIITAFISIDLALSNGKIEFDKLSWLMNTQRVGGFIKPDQEWLLFGLSKEREISFDQMQRNISFWRRITTIDLRYAIYFGNMNNSVLHHPARSLIHPSCD